MKIHLHNTDRVVDVDGVPARIWEGATDTGVPVAAVITRIAADRTQDLAELERDLQETPPPSAIADAWPDRITLTNPATPAGGTPDDIADIGAQALLQAEFQAEYRTDNETEYETWATLLVDERDWASYRNAARAVVDAVRPLIEAAALRAYANRSHPGAEGVSRLVDYVTVEYDAVCTGCGASWSDDEGGCTERVELLADAGRIAQSLTAAPVSGRYQPPTDQPVEQPPTEPS